MMRRVAAGLLFAALVAAGIRPGVLRLLLPPHRPPDRPAPAGALDRWPLRFSNDPTPPELQRFLEDARANTRPGERVGVLLAPPFNGAGYSHWRASYALSGRQVLFPPEVMPWDDPDVVVLWNTAWSDPDYDVAWSGNGGAVLRRRR
jgi:hypothetical protein